MSAITVDAEGKEQLAVTLPFRMLSSAAGCPAHSGSSRAAPVWASEVAPSFPGANFMDLPLRGKEGQSVFLSGRCVHPTLKATGSTPCA